VFIAALRKTRPSDVVAAAGFTKIATQARPNLLAASAANLQPAPNFLLGDRNPYSAC